ncbi:uncharacterized protein OCT59_013757 [Rhizophagus irregularis]|uniref:Uncharacterized protein n=3 Tax=Rhizophagus irregularis TaxID=588596 RepID=U9TBH8_RHIID|nr:hypothetical protein GLOIN_2v1599061 [Rhizophagus irregularis DAOM 181602=DAOM 197198]EXX54911.1 hypothetical protein RirG_230150 [Rhizophagus irregularis DAOM 197198w]PKK79076.1 hypothetical protein RhiirC2_728095 [Rhizophagus irregularis]POG72183.1 hypothetical protein GLOIN_2v1599061 [Rhizophagus irregularis DAOM 181602=DAOM 197198]UZO21361.1 hypothetical protein OCT59_013757 [Rhizophagus irregularis]CAB4389059.1 unnamed protein product [Rhizophagus irregularis]|eukprot:XP_025179049.1 hypothetical protein GLOIN_2v1599061 [Rhizophagus irregularis DAOM 181602=DAOM 197198]
MGLILIYFLLLIILRAGLVISTHEIESANENDIRTKYLKHYEHHEPSTTPTKTFPTNNLYSKTIPDICSEFGVISNCTLEKPYCFVDGDNIFCGPTEKLGWRISPLDGLILNNGQIPNPKCELFKPPENLEVKETIMNLLSNSEFGSGFEGRESAWFNIFEYLGNCPLKSKYCDKDLLTCQTLLSTGKNCTSSNQCLTHYCEKYDKNAPDDTTERKCVEENDINYSFGKIDDKASDSGGKGSLLIIISISVGFGTLILLIIIFLIRVQKKKQLLLDSSKNKLFPSDNYLRNDTTINTNQSRFVSKHLSSFSTLRSSLLSRISSTLSRSYSKNVKRDSSDQFSVLLPPPPTLNRDSFLYGNNYDNNNYYHNQLDNVSIMNDRDSFDIYPPNHNNENSYIW